MLDILMVLLMRAKNIIWPDLYVDSRRVRYGDRHIKLVLAFLAYYYELTLIGNIGNSTQNSHLNILYFP